MTLQNLKQSLEQEGKAEGRKIISQAEKHAEQIVAAAKENAKQIIAQAKERANESIESEKNERISAGKLKAKKIITEAMNKKIEEALEKVWQEFSKIPQSEDYEKLMKKYIHTAEKEFVKAIVHVNEQDEKIAKKFSKNVAQKSANITGGAIITNPDGKIRIDNSLESIFESRKDELRNTIYLELKKK